MTIDTGKALTAALKKGSIPSLATIGLVGKGNTLGAGGTLAPGQALVSANLKFIACLQGDGNFVVYNLDPKARDHDLWSTRTLGKCKGGVVAVQTDGNLVVYSAGNAPNPQGKGACWSSGTKGGTMPTLAMQNDGNLVLYSGPWQEGASAGVVALWSTKTQGGHRPSSGGLLGWVGRAISSAAKVISKVSPIAKLIPGLGQAISGIELGANVVGSMNTIASAGKTVIASNQVLSAGKALVPVTDHAGFDVGAAVLHHPGITPKALVKIRDSLPAAQKRGFDTAVSLQAGMATSDAPKNASPTAKAAFYATIGMQGATPGMQTGMLKQLATHPEAKAGVIAAAAEVKNKTFVQKVKEFFGVYNHQPLSNAARPSTTVHTSPKLKAPVKKGQKAA